MLRRIGRAAVVVGGIGVVIAALHWAARFGLAGPAGWTRDDLDRWSADPVAVVATVARWLALVLAYYLLVVVVMLAVWGESERLSRAVPQRWIAPLAALIGIGVVVAPLTATGRTSSAPLRLGEVAAPLVLDRVLDAPPAVGDQRLPLESSPAPADTVADAGEPPAPVPDNSGWVVEPGESMWSIACDVLTEAWGRRATDAEVIPYWREVIETNRDRLVEPGNPDLILPGQEFVIPEAPPDPNAASTARIRPSPGRS